ncbi:hypothetical protein [Paracandidimonas lactea]|uniref:hypothetical protein n=1 Tax=Paracandidimonas lactea TaxID=2895524 RepID=UPI003F6FDFEF
MHVGIADLGALDAKTAALLVQINRRHQIIQVDGQAGAVAPNLNLVSRQPINRNAQRQLRHGKWLPVHRLIARRWEVDPQHRRRQRRHMHAMVEQFPPHATQLNTFQMHMPLIWQRHVKLADLQPMPYRPRYALDLDIQLAGRRHQRPARTSRCCQRPVEKPQHHGQQNNKDGARPDQN